MSFARTCGCGFHVAHLRCEVTGACRVDDGALRHAEPRVSPVLPRPGAPDDEPVRECLAEPCRNLALLKIALMPER